MTTRSASRASTSGRGL